MGFGLWTGRRVRGGMVRLLGMVGLVTLLTACSGGWAPAHPRPITGGVGPGAAPEVRQALARFQAQMPALRHYFEQAYGYAIFPRVRKGGFLLGGAYGEGEVYAQQQLIGYASLTQLNVGLTFGGQAFSEVIFFRDKAALKRFTSGRFELGGQVSAAGGLEGRSLDLAFHQGVAVFTLTQSGLMLEAALGGQKFDFVPL